MNGWYSTAMSTVDASAPPTTAASNLFAMPAPTREEEREDERPQEIELLLDRERPDVPQHRRPADRDEVRDLVEDQVPVLDVEDRGDRLAPKLRDRVGEEEQGVEGDHPHHQEEGRQEPPRTAEVEPPEPDVVVLAPVAEEQAGDQVAADHEEDVNAEEAAGHPLHVAVIEEHGNDRERPQPIERGYVPDSRQARGDDAVRRNGSGHHTMVAREALRASATPVHGARAPASESPSGPGHCVGFVRNGNFSAEFAAASGGTSD